MYWQTIRRERSINGNDSFSEGYKFKTNLLLSTKLTTFFNLDELENWVLYIGTEGIFLINTKICFLYKGKETDLVI